MLYIFIIFLILSLIGISFKNVKNVDKSALSHERTIMINGFFVGLILFSHFNSYVTTNMKFDSIYYYIFDKIGQLMVTTFLFYSGYGIYESIKSKKKYIDNFFKNRILKLFISFFLALILYMLLNLMIGNSYSIKTILLSLLGWESIGNSNWFIFATFCMYFSTLISFKIFKKDNKSTLLLNTIFSFVYIILTMKLRGFDWWYNTILCYNLGMFISCYKDTILSFLENNRHYVLIFLLIIIIFLLSYKNNYGYFVYEIISMSFVLIIFLITLKVKIGNRILFHLGKNTFNIYILQRLSYIFYEYIGLKNYNFYLYFIVSVITTLLLSIIFDKLIHKIYKLLMLV